MSAFFCKKLAKLVTDVPLSMQLTEMEGWGPKSEKIDAFFQDIEFFTLRRRFQKFLEENGYARAHFGGSVSSFRSGDVPDEPQGSEKGRMTEGQLPLLD